MPSAHLWITPTMLRTRYHERPSAPTPPVDPERRPQLGTASDAGEASDAFTDWLGHLAAGRIEVR